MQKLLIAITMISLVFAVEKKGKQKSSFTVTGVVIGKDGEGLKKVKLTIVQDGDIVDEGKTNRDGEFKFKKLTAGGYTIICEHEIHGTIETDFKILWKDVDLSLKYKIDRTIEYRNLEIPPIAEFYLENSKNFESVDKDIKEIIETEMSKMYQNVQNDLYDILYFGYDKADPEYKTIVTGFDEDGYLTALLSLRNPSEAEAYWLKQQFYTTSTSSNSKISIMGKKIATKEYFPSNPNLVISKECPLWTDVIKYVGGYAELGKSGLKKENYKSLFTINQKYFEIEFVEDGKCIFFSKYFGNDKAFEYYKIDKESIEMKKGEYSITKIDYNILSGKREPQIIIETDEHSLHLNLYKIAPRAKKSLERSFDNYNEAINTMFKDLLTEDYNEKIANIHAEEVNKKLLANKKAEKEELNRKVEREKDLQKILALEEQLKNEYLDSMKTIIQSYKYLEIIKDNSTTERIAIVIETYDRLDSISFEKKEGVEVYIFEDEGDSAIESIQFSKPPKVRRLFQKGITKRGKLKLKGFFKSNFRVIVFDKDSDRYSQIRFRGKTGKNKITIYFSESGVEWKERKGFFEYTINEENIWNDHKEFLMYESIRKRKIQFSRTMDQKYLRDLLENNVP